VERAASVVQDVPASARARVRYGLALQKADRFDEAGEQFRIALRMDPTAEKAHYGLGHVLLAESKLNEAAGEMEEALRQDPRNGEFHSDYGYVLERLGRKDEAIAEYERGTQLNPKSGKVHYNYAMFLVLNGKLDQAIAEFQMVLRHNPNHPEAHYHLGRAFYEKRNYEGAKQHYLETARLDPKAPVHDGLGAVYFRLGQTSEAIAQFKEALRLNPDDAEAAENLRFALGTQTRTSSPPR
jgi:tetratricopeptide (TPR) repeat protein